MHHWILMFLVAFGIPLQAIINGRLGQVLGNPFLAALTSFITGTIVLLVVTLLNSGGIPKLPQDTIVPWYLFTGGLLGAIYVTAVLVTVPKMGPADLLTAGIAGQLFMGLILDHFGLLGMPVHPITLVRALGVAVMLTGAVMINKG
jgi:transporter family-2 protein